MTTFITGATTDLGRVLVREMVQQGEALRLLVRADSNRSGLELPGVEFIRGNVDDAVTVRKGMAGCDHVTHLDAPALSAGRPLPNDHVARLVMQAAHDVRATSVVLVSALTLLHPDGAGDGDDETHAVDLARLRKSHRAQHAAVEVAREFVVTGLAVKLVYPGLGYGYIRPPGEGGLAAWTLLRLAGGAPATYPGSDRTRLPVTYFKDTAQGIRLAHARGSPGEGYILVGETLTWPQIWAAIAEALDREFPTRRTPLWLARMTAAFPSAVLDLCDYDWNISSARAKRELDWQPLSFRDAIAETWADYEGAGMDRQSNTSARAMRRV